MKNFLFIKQEIRQFLQNSFKIKAIKDSENIFESGLVHSLFFIQLLVFIEKTFSVSLDASEFDITALNTVDAIATLVTMKRVKNDEC